MFKVTKDIIVFYHEYCLDGFASAYVAWKKFKNKADYIPLSYTADGLNILKSKKIKISDLKDREIYFIDFCLNEDEIKKVQKIAKTIMVIDHHIGKKELVQSLEGCVFRDGVSGAYLAHEYFFPNKPIPKLIQYISIGDTYNFSKNETSLKREKTIISYLATLNFDFKIFTQAEKDFEDKKRFLEIEKLARVLEINYLKLIEAQLEKAKLIVFEGYKVYAINASSVFKNELGHRLAQKTKLFTLIYSFEKGELKVSLRGEGKVDLSEIAKKYNGGGHFNAASFKTKDEKFIQEFVQKIIN